MATARNSEGYYDPTAYLAMRNIEMAERRTLKMTYKRGDIYFVEPYRQTIGSEQRSGRPAIIVSNDKNNKYSPCVEVVYLTTQPKTDLPTHVIVKGTGIVSTALCEQVSTVDRQRLTNMCGECSKNEMQAIDIALMISLGLDGAYPKKEKQEDTETDATERAVSVINDRRLIERYVAAKAERDMLQQMYGDLLRQVTTKRT